MSVDLSAALAWVSEVVGPIGPHRVLTGGWTSTVLAIPTVSLASDDVVLRLMTEEPWRTHGEAMTTRERDVQRMLADAEVPAPRSLALDADGMRCGAAAHLMTLLPGAIALDRSDDDSLTRLAEVLAAIHEVEPTIPVRDYQSWSGVEKRRVPPWAADPSVWEDAFALLDTPPPLADPVLIHRDFQPRNVLWVGEQISGVVDWVETSLGPAWLDVAHCSSHVSLRHGSEAADRFAAAYVAFTGRTPQPSFDVMEIVALLPRPGRVEFVQDPHERRRLEARLRTVLHRVG